MSARTPTAAVLVIAGSDSSCGAGLARDLRTLHDHGVEAVCAITAVTAQDDARVWSVHPVPPESIRAQILSGLRSRRIGAIKIGMLGSAPAVEAVAQSLPRELDIPLVLDPVLRTSSGGELLDEAGRRALCERLLARTTLLTPNIPEAAQLCGADAHAGSDAATRLAWAAQLLERGPGAVLIKGGHASGAEAEDLLAGADGSRHWLSSARLSASARGTGCALSSAIAAWMARGQKLPEACREARGYVLQLLERGC